MRVLAIGDIHGCSAALTRLLETVEIGPEDTVITLGDYVDRGPDSKGVLDILLALGQKVPLVALRGNHELMMLEARRSLRAQAEWEQAGIGGNTTVASYGSLEEVPAEHWEFMEQTSLRYWEMETHFFVHAGVYPELPLSEQPDYALFWKKFDYPPPHASGKIMVCGHTSQKNGSPINIGHAICLDTWACGTGWLSCLDINSGIIYQANQQGHSRTLRLDELLEA